MGTEGKRPRRQFSLKRLVVAIVLLSVGLSLFVRWWRTPFTERTYHANGTIKSDSLVQRDWLGRLEGIKTVCFYSTGQKAFESPFGNAEWVYWMPDGSVASSPKEAYMEWQYFDNGDGTFRTFDGLPRPNPVPKSVSE